MFLSALLAASLAAPIPKDKPAAVYFPTQVGAKRVLEWTINGGNKGGDTEVVTKVEEKDGVYTVTLDWGARARAATGTFAVTDKKVRRVGVKGREDWTMLDLGVKAGDTWTHESEVRGRKRVVTYTLGKEEEVEVPAGKFKAIPVTEEEAGGDAKTTSWYAPGIGMVRQERDSKDSKLVTVLKEFTPGKDAKK